MLRPYFFRCTFPRHVTPAAMADLKRSLRLFDGLAMVVGIMVGSGIFRTPGLVAAQLGRPWLTFVAWVLGGALAFLGALCFAELATRHPRAGGKYVYVREAFGPRAGFVVGWVESVGMYTAAIAAIGVAAAEFLVRLTGWDRASISWLGAGLVTLFTAVNLIGVASGRWVQNLVTAAKVLALGSVVAIAFARGTGAGWHGALVDAPRGVGVWPALALASRSVIWTYYGYPDAAKIAEEVVDPGRTLPRVFLGGIAIVTALYLLLNAAFLHVLPLAQIATSNLVAAEVLVIDGLTVAALFPLRAHEPRAPFSMPGYPAVPVLFIGVYLVLFAWTAVGQSQSVLVALAVLALAYGLSWAVRSGPGAPA